MEPEKAMNEVVQTLLKNLNEGDFICSAGVIDDAPHVIGVETVDGDEFFVEVQRA